MASADNFKIEVLTPAGVVLQERVSSVKVPSSEGEIGILPQHTKYSGILGSGILEYVVSPSGETKKLTISGGLSSFADETLTILADSVTQ